jgi:hypothetical protein
LRASVDNITRSDSARTLVSAGSIFQRCICTTSQPAIEG